MQQVHDGYLNNEYTTPLNITIRVLATEAKKNTVQRLTVHHHLVTHCLAGNGEGEVSGPSSGNPLLSICIVDD